MDGCLEHVRTASNCKWYHSVKLLASHESLPRPRRSEQTPGGGLRRSSMLQCSACCGAGLTPADERQHGAHCPPLLASPATRRRTQLRWQLRLPPQAIAASRAGRIYQRHRRRRAESPDAAKVSAGADFSQADIVGPSPVVAPVAPLPALPRKGLTGLAARIVFGVLLGVSGAIVILTGGWFYMAIACLVAYQASQEYFGFVTSKVGSHTRTRCVSSGRRFAITAGTQDYFCRLGFLRPARPPTISEGGSRMVAVFGPAAESPVPPQGISEGMQPPSPLATTLTTLSCIGLVVWTFVSHGRATSGLAVMSFAVLSLQLLGNEKPRFSQLTSSVFGMFYCGAQ